MAEELMCVFTNVPSWQTWQTFIAIVLSGSAFSLSDWQSPKSETAKQPSIDMNV